MLVFPGVAPQLPCGERPLRPHDVRSDQLRAAGPTEQPDNYVRLYKLHVLAAVPSEVCSKTLTVSGASTSQVNGVPNAPAQHSAEPGPCGSHVR